MTTQRWEPWMILPAGASDEQMAARISWLDLHDDQLLSHGAVERFVIREYARICLLFTDRSDRFPVGYTRNDEAENGGLNPNKE